MIARLRRVMALGSGEMAARLLGFVLLAILARLVGVEEFGILNFAMNVALVSGLLLDLGQNSHLIRTTAEDVEFGSARILGTIRVKSLNFVVVSAIWGVALLAAGQSVQVVLATLAMLVWVLGLGVVDSFRSLWRGTAAFAHDSMINAGESAIRTLVVVAAALLGASTFGVSLAFVAEAWLAAVIVMVFTVRKFPNAMKRRPWGESVDFVRGAWMAGLVSLSLEVLRRADQVIMQFTLGAEAGGVYGSAARLVGTLAAVGVVFGMSVYPRLSSLRDRPKECASEAWRGILLSFAVCSAIAVATFVTAPWLISFVYGEAFARGSEALRMLAPVIAVSGVISSASYATLALRRERALVKLLLSIEVVALPCLVLASRSWGLNGMAVAMSSTVLLTAAALVLLFGVLAAAAVRERRVKESGPREVLIMHAYSPSNLGDGAIVLSMVDEVHRVFGPDVSVTVSATEPELFESCYRIPSVHRAIPRPRSASKAGKLAWLATTGFPRFVVLALATAAGRGGIAAIARMPFVSSALRATLRSYLDADLVLAAGGGYLAEPYRRQFPFWWIEHRLANAAGVPLAFYSQSFSPPSRPSTRMFFRSFLRQASMFIARDNTSFDNVTALGSTARIELCADSVFASAPSWVKRTSAENDRRGRIGVSVMRWSNYTDRGADRHEAYLASLAETLEGLWSSGRISTVVLFPTNRRTEGNAMDDESVVEDLAARLGRLGIPTETMRWTHDPQAFMKAAASVELMVATRAHAAALTLSTGTAVAGIAYEEKMHGMLEFFGLVGHSCDIERPDLFKRVIGSAWEKRESSRRQVAARLNDVSTSSKRAMEHIASLIGYDFVKEEQRWKAS